MMNSKVIFACLLLFLLGCTQQGVYETIQRHEKQKCEKLPSAQYEDCIAQSSESYEDYQRAREDILKDEK